MMRLVLIGPPGAGKGTQAVLLKDKFKVPHISTGNILRQKIQDGSVIGRKAKSFVERGELVPDAMAVQMVKERLQEKDTGNGFILDGFPRTKFQAEALDVCLKELKTKIDFVLGFEVSEEVVIFRLSGRRVCKDCGENYHIKNKPPKKQNVCDKCGGPVIHRKDDAESTVRNRLKIYWKMASTLKEYYQKQGLWYAVDASLDGPELTRVLGWLFDHKK